MPLAAGDPQPTAVSDPIHRTLHAERAPVQYMRVHHRRRHIRGPEGLLHRADVMAGFPEVCREGVSAMPDAA